jgi:type IV pilus assembly protein PilQ
MKIALNLKQTAKSGCKMFNSKMVSLNDRLDLERNYIMRSPTTKYKRLGVLLVLAFVLVVFAIAVAQNGSDDSKQKEVMMIQSNGTVTQEPSKDSTPKDVPETEPNDQATQEPNGNSTPKDVPETEPNDQATQEPNGNSTPKDVPETEPNDQATQEPNGNSTPKDVPETEPNDQATQEPSSSAKPKETQMPLQQRMLKTISIDCTNTPIEDVMRMLAEQANVDIIKSPTVTGNVTAKLTNVPLEEALNNILAVNGYSCVVDKNIIRVAPAAEITQKDEVLESKVYRITYADVAQVESALKKFISKRGSISSNLGTSNIIVTDNSGSIRAIDKFVEEIDRVTPQVMIEVRIYDVTSDDGFDIGAEWSAGRNNPITTIDNVTGTSPSVTNTTATAWQNNDAGVASGTQDYTYKKSKPFVGGSFNATTGGTIRFGLLDTVNVELALNILSTNVGAKLLANPRILVLDNETADFKIVSEIPYTDMSQTSSGGSMTSTQFKDVGVELQVTPHVTRDGMVRLHVVPEFGIVSQPGTTTSTGVQTVPTVDTRKMDTKALLKDGQTVVIGGLRKRQVTQTLDKVPILGDVPIVKGLFSNVTEEVKTNELIIFITPAIVNEQKALSPREFKDYKATNFNYPRITNAVDEKAGETPEE